MNKSIIDAGNYWFVNDRYEIHKDNGTITDTENQLNNDIPQSIIGIRDRLMQYNRFFRVGK